MLEDTHNRTVRSCAWSPDGRLLATASFDATTAVWEYNGADFECVATLEVSRAGLGNRGWAAPPLPAAAAVFVRTLTLLPRVCRGTRTR